MPPASRALPDNPRFAERMALYFGALFLIYGVHITYFPVWLAYRGLTPEQIGLITALPIFMRTVLTPVIAARADTHANHRQMVIVLSVAAAALAIAMSFCHTFWPLLAVSVPFAISVSSIMPLTETIAVEGVRTAGHDYGRMRLWGSAAFLLATVVTGIMYDLYGSAVGIYVMIAATVLTAAAAFALPVPARETPSEGTLEAVLDLPGSSEAGLVRQLLLQPVFAAFLVCVGAILGSHAAFYTFGALHLKSQGLSGTAFSALWGMSIFAEIALLAASLPLVARFGPVRLLMAGGIAAVVRWGAMSLDPPFAGLVVLQALHAFTYGAAHLGAIHFIAQAVPTRATGTAQGLYSAIGSGLITGLAVLASGHLYPLLGGRTFLAMGALALLGVAAAVWIEKSWDRKPIEVAA